MNRYPIYIPSRGRAGTATTPRLLEKWGLDYRIVVEKKEADEYEAFFPGRVLSLPGSDYGHVNVARSFCKTNARLEGHAYHWQIDDDMTRIYQHAKGVRTSENVELVFRRIEKFVDLYQNVGLVGISSSNFLKNKVKEYQVNTYAYGVMLVKSDAPYEYQPRVTDLDYNLGLLFAGFCTVRFDCFAFSTPTMSSRPGGCTDLPREEFIKNTLKRWPDIIPGITKKGDAKGKVKVRLNTNAIWAKFKKQPILRPKSLTKKK